jgi:signal recognition particle receptor subunit beta
MRHEQQAVVATIIVCGPPQSGKGATLRMLQAMSAAGTAGQIHAEDRHSERVQRLDVAWPDLPRAGGSPLVLRLLALPGATYYAAGRRSHLAEADGLLFVADSRRESLDENIAALNDLFSDLRAVDRDRIPAAMLFNKQDAPGIFPPEQLQPLLNARSWPAMASSAVTGAGLRDAILALAARVAAEAPPPAAAPRSWLMTCWRCQTMLEIAAAAPGQVFTCGACRTSLEIVDPDRGITRAPPRREPTGANPVQRERTGPNPVQRERTGAQPAIPEPPRPRPAREDSDPYPVQSLPLDPVRPGTPPGGRPAVGTPAQGASVLPLEGALAPRGSAGTAISGSAGLPPGYEAVAIIDESPLGRRLRVRDASTGRTWRALVVPPSVMAQPGFSVQVQGHVRLAGPLKHVRLAALHSLTPVDGSGVFIADDATDREPLGHVLARRRVLAPPHAVSVALQILEGLEAAAQAGVVHGWIRPEVIWLTADGDVQVDEVYVPKPHRHLRAELNGPTAATEYYLAPEMTQDDVVPDARTDLFAVGALLFRMLSGQGLVTGYTAHEALHKFVAAGPTPLRNIVPNLSRDLEQVVKRMCAVDRRERYQSHREAIDVLHRFGGGAHRQTMRLTQPVSLREPSPHSGHPVVGRTTTIGGRSGTGGGRSTGQIQHRPAARRSSGAGIGIAIVAAVLVAAVVAALVYANAPRPHDERAAPPAPQSPTPSVSAPLPARPVAPAPGPAPSAPPVVIAPPDRPAEPMAAQPTAPAPAPGADLRQLRTRFTELLLQERFGDAAALVPGFPADEQPVRKTELLADRSRRKAEIATAIAADPAAAASLLEAPLRRWGIDEDRLWAQQLLASRAPATEPVPGPAVPVVPAAPPVEPSDPGFAVHLAAWRAAAARFDHAGTVGEASRTPGPEGVLLSRASAWLRTVPEALARGAAARVPQLRLTHPITREAWDVRGADAQGVELVAPNGGSARVPWTQLALAEVAQATSRAAAGNGTGDAHAAAVVAFIAAGRTDEAALHLKRHRAAVPQDLAEPLARLIDLSR